MFSRTARTSAYTHMIRKTICCFLIFVASSFADAVSIVVPEKSPEAIRSAAVDMKNALQRIFPDDNFEFGKGERFIEIAVDGEGTFESFRIRKTADGKSVRILGADPLGAVFGVYELLEQYGCGFYLTYDTFPQPHQGKWTPPAKDFEDAPLCKERYTFN